MGSIPDFGYKMSNDIIEKEDAPRNWKLLTELVSNKSKFELLSNHIQLRKIRHKQEQEEELTRMNAR